MRSHTVVTGLIGSLAAACLACASTTEPSMPPGAVRMAPAKPFALWWSAVENCSARTTDTSLIRWFVVPGTTSITVGGEEFQGYWFGGDRSIVLAETAVTRGAVVRHEMLHALTNERHEREYFLNKCGGIVACEARCAVEVRQPVDPPPQAPETPARNLELTMRVSPSMPGLGKDSGWVVLEVSAKNPLDTSIWALLDPVAAGSSASATFGYTITCVTQCDGSTGSEYLYIESSRIAFQPSSTRRHVFDVRLGTGTYSIAGTFNGRATTATTVTVTP